MDLFKKAKKVHLRSNRDKYLIALDDEETVSLDGDGSTENANWIVEIVNDESCVCFISCYGKYLTATNVPFLPGVTAKKVLQTGLTEEFNSSVMWDPQRDGFQVRLKTRTGTYLRPNGGIPPWRNSVTHDTPHRPGTIEKVLWDVEVVEAISKEKEKNCHRKMGSDSVLSRSTSFNSHMYNQKACKKRSATLVDFAE